jgi:sugar phosphate isomerase/epimerase
MQLAIREHLLTGITTDERLAHAQQLGVEGVHFDADGLYKRVGDINTTLTAYGLQASGVHLGGTHLLHPDISIRDRAIKACQQAMTNVLDLGAVGVTLYTHAADTPRLPDLHPYKSNVELEAEFFIMQLKATLADFAYATGARVDIAPQINGLLHRLDMAAKIIEHNDDHPNLKITADTACMVQHESDVHAALRQHVHLLGSVYLHNVDGALITTLHDAGYTGWLIIDGDDALQATAIREAIAS